MSHTYHGNTNLIALPNRTVQTYPSGLVRVERSFVCPKFRVAKYRETIKVNEPMPFDDGAPAIDGLYIFPEPQEIVRDDGFVEFRVTAYGRTNIFSNIAIEKTSIKSNYTRTTVDADGVRVFNPPSINDIFIIRGVAPSSTPTIDFLTPPQITNISIYDLFTQQILVEGEQARTSIVTPFIRTKIFLTLDSYDSTNFGIFSEYSVIWRADAEQDVFY